MFLRPCQAVAQHMISLASEHKELQFANRFAEQDFIAW